VGDVSGAAQLSWDLFIRMSHVVEQIPLLRDLVMSTATSANLSDAPSLTVSMNVNKSIDVEMHADFVASQQAWWGSIKSNLEALARSRSAEVLDALARGDAQDQIVYFYCHAETPSLNHPEGPDASCLKYAEQPAEHIRLGDLECLAPTDKKLRGDPLAFINACESAKMSARFYDGFLPYFIAKGARGVVGTECEIPALFAAAWAMRFFHGFLTRQTLGEAFLAQRREFLEKYGNPLGLFYSVHCDGDTHIQPELKVPSTMIPTLVGKYLPEGRSAAKENVESVGENQPHRTMALLHPATQAGVLPSRIPQDTTPAPKDMPSPPRWPHVTSSGPPRAHRWHDRNARSGSALNATRRE
jgi:hypothetical protein